MKSSNYLKVQTPLHQTRENQGTWRQEQVTNTEALENAHSSGMFAMLVQELTVPRRAHLLTAGEETEE